MLCKQIEHWQDSSRLQFNETAYSNSNFTYRYVPYITFYMYIKINKIKLYILVYCTVMLSDRNALQCSNIKLSPN